MKTLEQRKAEATGEEFLQLAGELCGGPDDGPLSPGTRIAEENRARMNNYTDEQRQALLNRGLAIIYASASDASKTPVRSR